MYFDRLCRFFAPGVVFFYPFAMTFTITSEQHTEAFQNAGDYNTQVNRALAKGAKGLSLSFSENLAKQLSELGAGSMPGARSISGSAAHLRVPTRS